MWQHEEGKDPFDYFKRKYGEPTVYATNVKLIPPDGVERLEIKVPDGQVWIGYVEEDIDLVQ